MNKSIGFILIAVLLGSCHPENSVEEEKTSFDIPYSQAVSFQHLTLYPVVASNDFIQNNEGIKALVNLKDAIQEERFRITEKKPYGRSNDAGAVNVLTVQNKTPNTIFLMNGDIVQGGRQDRVLAQNRIIPPRTITDIDVFCVEKGRWEFREEGEEENSQQKQEEKKILAFRGYYNVASSQVRRSMKYSNKQEEVWEQVSDITSANEANSQTHAYADLETSESYIQQRKTYLQAFESNFELNENVIGLVAVSGSEILGTDIFGHPDLFRRQYHSLLHSYITDAITLKKEGSCSEERIKVYADQLWTEYLKGGDGINKLDYQGALVCFSKL